MGYTHYWKVQDETIKEEVLRDVEEIFVDYQDIIQAEFNDGAEPVARKDAIVFNGRGDDGHETFYLAPDGQSGFCKTNGKPYDLAVCETLLVLKHHYGNEFELGSDGFYVSKEDLENGTLDGNWNEAINNVMERYGYEFEFVPKTERSGGFEYHSFEVLSSEEYKEKFRFGHVVNQDLTMGRKEKAFNELLVSELLKEEHEYCFDKSYMSDDVWEKRYGSLDRASAYLHRKSDLVGKVSSGKLADILSEYDHDRFDHLYEEVRNVNGHKFDEYTTFVMADPDGEFLKEKNVEALMKDRFFSLGEVEEVHSMKLLSDDERVEFLKELGFRIEVPTYEGVKEWERAFPDKSFYRGIEEVGVDEALEIADMYDTSDHFLGQFYYKGNSVFIGIDNSGGMCWTEEFKSLNHCMEWLGGEDYSRLKDLDWYIEEQSQLGSLDLSPYDVKDVYSPYYVDELDADVQDAIEKDLTSAINDMGFYSHDDIKEHVQNGMDGRVCDLEDTIDVYNTIKKTLELRGGSCEVEREESIGIER